jgi:ABC-type multidrug transport system ATPase subunit
MGDVPLIFMDEPTTGLDPEVRRTIWNIIQKAKQGKTIILTTHSMEEADFLSSRIGIMSKGVLRCLGTPLHLKRKYGRGFKLTASFYKETDRAAIDTRRNVPMLDTAQASSELEKLLPRGGWRKLDQGGVQGSVTYEFEDHGQADEKGVISKLLDEIESRKSDLGIEDWGISQTSLEEVFLNIVKDEDLQATTS